MTANLLSNHPDLPEPEGQPQGQKVVLAGKYQGNTLEEATKELERGYTNLFEEGKKLVARIQELESRALASGHSWDGGVDRLDPAERIAARSNPLDALAEAGVPVVELKELIKEQVMQGFQPIIQGANARQTMVQDYPEFAQFEGELAQFIEANPQLKARYNRAYAADPEVALKWAFTEFSRANGVNRQSASGEAQASARLDASLPGRGVPVQRSTDGFDTATYNQLKQEAARTGDWSKVIAYKTAWQIPESHLNGLG